MMERARKIRGVERRAMPGVSWRWPRGIRGVSQPIIFLAAINLAAVGYELSPTTVNAGGGECSGGDYTIISTVGEGGVFNLSTSYSGVSGFVPLLEDVDLETVSVLVGADPEDGGSTAPDGETTVFKDASLDISCEAADGFVFLNWSAVGGVEFENPAETATTATCASDASITAEFGQKSISVISPNGGERWECGQSYIIRWASAYIEDDAAIYLMRADAPVLVIASAVPVADKAFEWTLPVNLNPAADYRVKILSLDEPDIAGVGDGDFAVYAESTANLTVTTPNGGEKLVIGGEATISWDADHYNGQVGIRLYDKNAYYSSVVSATANNGSFSWDTSGVATGNEYRIEIASLDNPAVRDCSDGFFSLVSSAPPADGSVTVTAPNGGESFRPGETTNILWESENLDGALAAYLFSDTGNVAEIGTAAVAAGTLSWTVAESLSAGNGYRVKLVPLNSPSAWDFSNNTFTISSLDEADLTMGTEPAAGGSVEPEGTITVNTGEPVALTASPETGYEFAGWILSDGAEFRSPALASCEIALADDASATAVFAPETTEAKVRIKFDTAKVGKDMIKMRKMYFTDSFSFDYMSDEVTVYTDFWSLELARDQGEFSQAGNKRVYKYKSNRGLEPKISWKLNLEKGYWDLTVNKISGLDDYIDNSDGVAILCRIEDFEGTERIIGAAPELDETTKWSFNEKKNSLVENYGDDFAIGRCSGKYYSDKSKKLRDAFSATKGRMAAGREFSPEYETVAVTIDNWWRTTLSSSFKQSGTRNAYSWKGDTPEGDGKINLSFDLDKGTWSFKLSKGNLDGVGGRNGIDFDLIIGGYEGGGRMTSTQKTSLGK